MAPHLTKDTRPVWPHRAVVTAGMPYGNKNLHFGHVGGVFIPADFFARFLRDRIGAKNVPDVIKEHREIMALIDAKNTEGIESLMSTHLYGGIRRLGSKLFSDEYKNYFQPAF